MSSDFYFCRWRETLDNLEELVNEDIEYQTTKAHDKTICPAMLRLTAVLGQYMTVYNDIMECRSQNLQVQKTPYIQEVVDATIDRILELKNQVSKLIGSDHIFINNGLIFRKNTSYDAELIDIPNKSSRSNEISEVIEEATERAQERMKLDALGPQVNKEANDDFLGEEIEVDIIADLQTQKRADLTEKKNKLTEEEEEIKRNILIIQAQERARKVVTELIHKRIKRKMWAKELEGSAAPKPPAELCERGALIIQRVIRSYFELKRKRVKDAEIDELLGIRRSVKPKNDSQNRLEQVKARRTLLKEQFEHNLKSEYEIIKEKYLKQRKDDICESYRDYIRDWFYMWYDKIKVFYNIPEDKVGGSRLILREEVPCPDEYLDQYQAYLAEKKAKKRTSAHQKWMAKLEAKREAEMIKKLEKQKDRQRNEIKRKLLKNPSQHPGYDFPESTKTKQLLSVIKNYHNDWDDYDDTGDRDVKEKHNSDVARNNAYADVKMELIPQVDAQMRLELKKLKKAIKKDYENNELEYPEMVKPRKKGKGKKFKKPVKVVSLTTEDLAQKMEELVFLGIVKGYDRIKLQDFVGDPNFIGDDVRYNYGSAEQFHGDARRLWWNRCHSMSEGFCKTLLVGPRGSGKTVLMHALASLKDAILFELDVSHITEERRSGDALQQLAADVLTCARAAQPALIHIRGVHRLYYKKVLPREKSQKYGLFKKYFTRKLWKKIQKTDKITIIGSCVNPWKTRSAQLLKDFPDVVLMPNTSYSVVVQMLNDWVLSNNVVPADLNVSSLAQVLQGYSYGDLQGFLARFLNADRVARISCRGLCPKDILETFLEEDIRKPDFASYLQWYKDCTPWGKKERAHLLEQKEFKEALDKWRLKREKDKKKEET